MQFNRTFFFISIFFLALILTGCVTFYGRKKDPIYIYSYPQGAQVMINGEVKGTTPFAYMLKRKLRKPKVQVHLGSKAKKINIKRNFVFGSLFSILPGVPIDIITGQCLRYSPSYYEIWFEKKDKDYKTHLSTYYNIYSNYYILTYKGDTIYCQPTIKWRRNALHYKDFKGKNQSINDDLIKAYKCVEFDDYFMIPALSIIPFTHKVSNAVDVVYESRPLKEENLGRLHYLTKVELQNNKDTISLNSVRYYDQGGTHVIYYLYKKTHLIGKLTKENFKEMLETGFSSNEEIYSILSPATIKRFSKLKQRLVQTRDKTGKEVKDAEQ